MPTLYSRQNGFSLIEIMIAGLLGMLLLAALTQIYVSIKTAYQFQQGLATIQENGRLSTFVLQKNIRQAGYALCVSSNQLPVLKKEFINGYDSHHLPDFLRSSRVVADTDVIAIHVCNKINQQDKLVTMAFYIADRQQKNASNQPIDGLYEKTITANNADVRTRELVSGIENMQIVYGLGDDKEILSYKNTSQMLPEDWQKVRSMNISLLLNSINPILKKPAHYQFNEKTITATDRLLHKPWDIYIALRERQQ